MHREVNVYLVKSLVELAVCVFQDDPLYSAAICLLANYTHTRSSLTPVSYTHLISAHLYWEVKFLRCNENCTIQTLQTHPFLFIWWRRFKEVANLSLLTCTWVIRAVNRSCSSKENRPFFAQKLGVTRLSFVCPLQSLRLPPKTPEKNKNLFKFVLFKILLFNFNCITSSLVFFFRFVSRRNLIECKGG